ncbi:MAG: hypothetical protein AAFX87_27095, partial [Bacteroidota bacterium]
KRLKELRLDNYYGDQTPYKEIYSLPRLEVLGIEIKTEFQYDGISQLKNLKILYLDGSHLSNKLGNLTGLKGLAIYGHREIDYPKSLRNLQNLEALEISRNPRIIEAPDFIPRLKKLRYLHIRGCDQLKNFAPSYNEMENIQLIFLEYNKMIEEVPQNLSNIKDKVEVIPPLPD